MSWHRSTTAGAFSYRLPITIDNSGAAATVDSSFDLSTLKLDDHFWGNVLSSGYDLVPTLADGDTLIAFELVSFNATTRTGTLELDAIALQATAGMYVIWLYYGNPSATNLSSAFVPAGPVAAYADRAVPGPEVIRFRPESAGALNPRNRIVKAASEERFVFFDVTDYLALRQVETSGTRRAFEEVFGAVFDVQVGGASQAAMFSATAQRFIYHRGRTYIRAKFQAGTSGTEYVVIMKLWTRVGASANHQIIEARAMLYVQNVTEA